MRASFATLFVLSFLCQLVADEPKSKDKEVQPAGKSEVLRAMPKKFATLVSSDAKKREVTLLLEGDKEPKTWPANPDAEFKVHGWWGRIDHFTKGDRVWVWFDVDRKKQPKSILMLADELSQQDLHGTPCILKNGDPKNGTISLEVIRGGKAELLVRKLGPALQVVLDGGGDEEVIRLFRDRPDHGLVARRDWNAGTKLFHQAAEDCVRLIVDEAELELLRAGQQKRLRELWTNEGLPGTVTFMHPLGGELDYMLDHEAIRWGRSLKKGDKVRILAAEPIIAVVKSVTPWRERTMLRLVANGFEMADLSLGQRVNLKMDTPAKEVDESEYPPDIERTRSKEERVEWFIASTYCTCKVGKDTCTGMFYTLASCNSNSCGMPDQMRGFVRDRIDKGLTDKQIWDDMKKARGPLMAKQHLLP